MFVFGIVGRPASVNNRGAFYAAWIASVTAAAVAAALAPYAAARPIYPDPAGGLRPRVPPVKVALAYVYESATAAGGPNPMAIDVDNFIKPTLDGASGQVFTDDSQVGQVFARRMDLFETSVSLANTWIAMGVAADANSQAQGTAAYLAINGSPARLGVVFLAHSPMAFTDGLMS